MKTYTKKKEKEESLTIHAKGRFVTEETMRDTMKLKETRGPRIRCTECEAQYPM